MFVPLQTDGEEGWKFQPGGLLLLIYLELNIKLEHLSVSLLPLSYCPPRLPDEPDVFHLCVLIVNPPYTRSGCPSVC